MEIDNKKLRDIILKVLEEISFESNSVEYYIVFSAPWSNLYHLAIDELKNLNLNLHILVSSEIDEKHREIIKESLIFKEFVVFNDDSEINYEKGKTIFLKLSRNDVIDISNLYAKNFETKLVKKLLAKGLKINYWNKGLEKIVGKEPIPYQRKLLKYYEELFEFGIFPIELKAVKK